MPPHRSPQQTKEFSLDSLPTKHQSRLKLKGGNLDHLCKQEGLLLVRLNQHSLLLRDCFLIKEPSDLNKKESFEGKMLRMYLYITVGTQIQGIIFTHLHTI